MLPAVWNAYGLGRYVKEIERNFSFDGNEHCGAGVKLFAIIFPDYRKRVEREHIKYRRKFNRRNN